MRKIIFLLLAFLALQQVSAQEARLLRFPAVYGNQVVFSYAGDLYTVARSGGTARKLTNDPGYEMFPHFSHDGKQIAFTAQYDGNTEVYIMPSQGGVPKRITFTATLDRDDVSWVPGVDVGDKGGVGRDGLALRTYRRNCWRGRPARHVMR